MGIRALEAGERKGARRQFAQVVLAEPNNAEAWLWLGHSTDDESQRQECWARVRQLNQRQTDAQGTATAPNQLEPADVPPVPSAKNTGTQGEIAPPPPLADLENSARRPGRQSILIALAVVALITLTAVSLHFGLFATRPPFTRARAGSPVIVASEATIKASGIIQADEVSIASQYGGRIATLPIGEGETVAVGDVVVQLDKQLPDAQIRAAQVEVSLAQANLTQARAGARPGQVAVAQAQLAQAEQVRLAAMQAVSDTTALLGNPQGIRMRIAVHQAQLEAEEHRLAQRLALKDAAEVAKEAFVDAQGRINDAGGPGQRKIAVPGVPGGYATYTVPSLPLDAHLAPNYWWQAWVGVNATAAQKEGLEATLAHLYAQQQQPQELETQADRTRSALQQAEAQVAVAQARLDGIQAGATEEQIAALDARVGQAQATLDTLLSRRANMDISAPIRGIVTDAKASQGEVAAPGATLLTIADLSRVRLVVYLPETQLGWVFLRQPVQVTVDSFPGRAFTGQVTHIADRAEFTPRNVATQEQRVNLVFAVEIELPNEDGALKPGMPADAVFRK
jgi:multidrug resistance efflux pump